jgi:hydroxymethylglutaryl-CoA lyase
MSANKTANTRQVHLVECPRDAIQGWPQPISTEDKVAYYKSLLDVGFQTLDMGSFVSPEAVPQMTDTGLVLQALDDEGFLERPTQILTIVANNRGAKEACLAPKVDDLGFPFSISETFQQRNTRSSQGESLVRLESIQETAKAHNKRLVIYLSMGFGNPYGEAWSLALLEDWAARMIDRFDPAVIALSDTVGTASPETVRSAFANLTGAFPKTEFGAHLHATPFDWLEKTKAAWDGGCRRFDGAIRGIGGCPFAEDKLVGNVPMEGLIDWLGREGEWSVADNAAWDQAQRYAAEMFA